MIELPAKFPKEVYMTDKELEYCYTRAREARRYSVSRGHRDNAPEIHHLSDPDTSHDRGFGGQGAFCKAIEVPLYIEINSFSNHGDVYGMEVRSTKHPRGNLIFKSDDGPIADRVFWLVIDECPKYTVMGWAWGTDYINDAHWATWLPKPGWVCPREEVKTLWNGEGFVPLET